MRIKSLVYLILAFLLPASSFTMANASNSPVPVGENINFYPNGSVQYVRFSDSFYVKHGFVVANWSGLPADVQDAFLDPQQSNFTLQTSASNFQNPSLIHFTEYDNETDEMYSLFFFQFHPGDLALGTYSFTGTWSASALANPPNHTTIHSQRTVTIVIVTPVPVGVNVTIDPASGLNLTFSNVTAEGWAWANKTSTVEAPLLANLVGQYYDTRVTASHSGNVTVSLAYDDSDLTQPQENNLQMMQYTPNAGDVVDYGQVNILDIAFLAKCFGTKPCDPLWDAAADIDGNWNISILDLAICARNFGKTAEWTNITIHVHTELNIVQGETTHFSIIGIH